MNREDISELAKALVDGAYIEQGCAELRRREAAVLSLLSQRCIPDDAWDEDTITYFMTQLSLMDSNNFSGAVGAGEREGRIYSSLVRRRHFGLGHGIGRSGDVAAVQPKAAGSSLIYKLTNRMALHALRLCGIIRAEAALVLPTATGLSLSLVLLTLLDNRKKELAKRLASAGDATSAAESPRFAIWSRVDQKSCYKSLLSAGLTPVVVEPLLVGDELVTDVEGIRAAIERCGPTAVVAVVTTASCFAPRAPDDVVEVARMCKAAGVPHLINNAYGLQVSSICHALNEACRVGRVDAIVSSTDKNFMVPVGGAIVASPSADVITAVSRVYPGRASVAPILDLFLTFLGMGVSGLKALLAQRKDVAGYLRDKLAELAAAHGERLLQSRRNHISFAFTVGSITSITSMGSIGSTGPTNADAGLAVEAGPGVGPTGVGPTSASGAVGGAGAASASAVAPSPVVADADGASSMTKEAAAVAAAVAAAGSPSESVPSAAPAATRSSGSSSSTYLGSMLFSRGVSGTRVVHPSASSTIDGRRFTGYGSQVEGGYPHGPYMTAAAAMGMTRGDVDLLMARLHRTIADFRKQMARQAKGKGKGSDGNGAAAAAAAACAPEAEKSAPASASGAERFEAVATAAACVPVAGPHAVLTSDSGR